MTFSRAAILWVAVLGFVAAAGGTTTSRGGRFEVEGSVAAPESLGPSRSPDSTLELWGGFRPAVGEEALFTDGFETGDLSSWTSDSGAIR